MKHLIVNADDVGADEARNEGIFQAIGAGMVTSISILANGPALGDALRRIRELARDSISLGIHCNLSEGMPLTSGLEHIAGSDGRFLGKKQTQRLLTFPASPKLQNEILRELNAQVDKLREAGIEPDHLDGHQHVHIFPAALAPVMEVAKTQGISWIRVPHEPKESALYPVSTADQEEAHFFSRHAAEARPVFSASGLLATNHFRGLYFKGRLPSSHWIEFLSALPHGLTELMVHPGRRTEVISGPLSGFSTQDREMELQGLVDGRFRNSLLETGVELTRFPAARSDQ
jgi:chitin disaccharide deacetylase